MVECRQVVDGLCAKGKIVFVPAGRLSYVTTDFFARRFSRPAGTGNAIAIFAGRQRPAYIQMSLPGQKKLSSYEKLSAPVVRSFSIFLRFGKCH